MTYLRTLCAAIAIAGCGATASPATSPPAAALAATPMVWCRPAEPCWPSSQDWQQLASHLHGKLEQPRSPIEACQHDAASTACTAAQRAVTNPYFLEDQLGATQSAGWLDAWLPVLSPYAIVAQDAGDVAAGVRFAVAHRLRIAIKATGHDYLGRSSAPDSLLIWTHAMREVSVLDAFVPQGCTTPPVPAVRVGAGTRWLEAYQAVTVEHHRYVQGGGCTSVGAAGGFLQGGGFGSWSKKYGTAAAGLLEAEVVTANGDTIIANACQHADLWWALRGGGGGTFGVVTKATLMTQPLPTTFGSLSGKIYAKSDDAFRELLVRFVAFYRDRLNNEHWGESVNVDPGNVLELSLAFQGLSETEAEAVWQPLRAWLAEHPDRYTVDFSVHALPAEKMWSYDFFHTYAANAIVADDRPEAPRGHFWWAGDAEQVYIYWFAYRSRWLPIELFEGDNAPKLAAALFEASRHSWFSLHFNEGLAGASEDALRRSRDTATNPAVLHAAALLLTGKARHVLPGVAGHEPDRAVAAAEIATVDAAMAVIRAITPDAGSYVNETDYFEPDWQRSFWGDNYQRLLQIKRAYDPHDVFACHHCVGSEVRGL